VKLLEGLTSDETKTATTKTRIDNIFLYFGKWWRHMKTNNNSYVLMLSNGQRQKGSMGRNRVDIIDWYKSTWKRNLERLSSLQTHEKNILIATNSFKTMFQNQSHGARKDWNPERGPMTGETNSPYVTIYPQRYAKFIWKTCWPTIRAITQFCRLSWTISSEK